ncbi:MAG TPA: VOC family protein [Mycobacteriales bacterium]|uniref:VOC family protein n=1 Tax=Amycolatopsis sp. TaxID=37632 RepID=UPI002CD1C9F9|nr:VOC family protein [Amycolatopsis sp.]HVV07617.1 VOC family protein [Amycolatopsis sp.]HVX46839.1 VOC family protein [Mycobacteriales bacterium]
MPSTNDRDEIRRTYLAEYGSRPPTTARGMHHIALLSSDVRRTIEFYQRLLEFPLTDIFENRDYAGSNHFFFDIGGGSLLAFFDMPGLNLGPYAEVLGGLHHLAISVAPDRWEYLGGKLDAAGVEYLLETNVSLYFRAPDRTGPSDPRIAHQDIEAAEQLDRRGAVPHRRDATCGTHPPIEPSRSRP